MSTAAASTHTQSLSGKPLCDQCLCKSEKMRALWHRQQTHPSLVCLQRWCCVMSGLEGDWWLWGVIGLRPWWTLSSVCSTLQQSSQLSTDTQRISDRLSHRDWLKGIFKVYFQPVDGILSPQNNLFTHPHFLSFFKHTITKELFFANIVKVNGVQNNNKGEKLNRKQDILFYVPQNK